MWLLHGVFSHPHGLNQNLLLLSSKNKAVPAYRRLPQRPGRITAFPHVQAKTVATPRRMSRHRERRYTVPRYTGVTWAMVLEDGPNVY
jgi:hypothetical protein